MPGGTPSERPCRMLDCRLHDFEELESTNAKAMEMASKGAPEGTVVIARRQTRGRGRLDREWRSSDGGLYLSIILRPEAPASSSTVLPFMAGLCVSKTLSTSCGIVSSLKWPNDVLIGDRKVCGILTESSVLGDRLEYVVIGIGINVNNDIDSLDADVRERSTSLGIECGKKVDLGSLTSDLLFFLDMHYSRFLDGQADSLLADWTERSSTIGTDVSVLTSSGEVRGKALALDGTGALVLKVGSRLERIDYGDCIHIERGGGTVS